MNATLNNKWYDRLKWIAMIFLPALGSFYFGLAPYWDFPKAEEVVGSIMVLDTFLGALLGLSNLKYRSGDAQYDGTMVVEEDRDGLKYNLDVKGDLSDIPKKQELRFKVEGQ